MDQTFALAVATNLGLDLAAVGEQKAGREIGSPALSALAARGFDKTVGARATSGLRIDCDIEPPEA